MTKAREKVYLPTGWEDSFTYFETLEDLTESVQPNCNNEIEYHEANIVWRNLIKNLSFDYLAERLIDSMASEIYDGDYGYDDCDDDFLNSASSHGLEKKLETAIESVMDDFPPLQSYSFENVSELKTLKVGSHDAG